MPISILRLRFEFTNSPNPCNSLIIMHCKYCFNYQKSIFSNNNNFEPGLTKLARVQINRKKKKNTWRKFAENSVNFWLLFSYVYQNFVVIKFSSNLKYKLSILKYYGIYKWNDQIDSSSIGWIPSVGACM